MNTKDLEELLKESGIHVWTASKRGVEVEFSIELDGEYGSFEIYDVDSGGENWYAGGGLYFEGDTLTEYDGVSELPVEIINKLNELGFDTGQLISWTISKV